MNTKKILSVAVIAATTISQASAAQSMDDAGMNTGMGMGKMYAEDMGMGSLKGMKTDDSVRSEDSVSSDSDDSSEDESSVGDATVTGGEIRKGGYSVTGDLTIEGVLYVFGNLDVTGDLIVAKNAKLRVTGKLSVTGDLANNGGSIYAAKRSVTGDTNNAKTRKLEALASEIDGMLSANLSEEEREEAIKNLSELKNVVRVAEARDLFEDLEEKIQSEDAAAFAKLVKKQLEAVAKRIKMQGGLSDKQLEAFVGKFESMATDRLEAFVGKLDKVIKATKKKKFAFQVKQLKDAAESVLEGRELEASEPAVTVPAATPTDSSSSSTASGTTATSSTGTTASGTTSSETSTGSSATSTGTTTGTGTAQ